MKLKVHKCIIDMDEICDVGSRTVNNEGEMIQQLDSPPKIQRIGGDTVIHIGDVDESGRSASPIGSEIVELLDGSEKLMENTNTDVNAPIDTVQDVHDSAVADTTEESLVSISTSEDNLMLEETFKNLSEQAEKMAINEDPKAATSYQESHSKLQTIKNETLRNASPRKPSNLPRVATLALKKADQTSVSTNDLPANPHSVPTLPRVTASNSANKVPTTISRHTTKTLTRLPRVATLPHPQGVVPKYKDSKAEMSKARKPKSRLLRGNGSSYNYLKHTASSAAKVSPHARSPPRAGDLVTHSPLRIGATTPCQRKGPNSVESYNISTTTTMTPKESKNSNVSHQFLVEYEEKLDSILSMELNMENFTRNDNVVDATPRNTKVTSKEVSPDDARAIDLDGDQMQSLLGDSSIVPKNLNDNRF